MDRAIKIGTLVCLGLLALVLLLTLAPLVY